MKKERKKISPRTILVSSVVGIMLLTIAYATIVSATFNSELQISGEAVLTTDLFCDNPFNHNALKCRILADNGGQKLINEKVAPNFAHIATTDEGIFKTADQYTLSTGMSSYYYRGAVINNNLIFAEHQWKIIRIAGNGTIRLLYNGPCPENNCEINTTGSNIHIPGGTQQWNTAHRDDNKYVGFMFGGANGVASTSLAQANANETNSNIKSVIDTWYENNILSQGSSVTNLIADTIYCNDRSIISGSGFGDTNTVYGPMSRLLSGFTPNQSCYNPNDRFSVNAGNGNGALTHPVGLLTADEASMAGAVAMMANPNYYLNAGQTYWTMSPSSFNGNNARMWVVFANGSLNPNAFVDYTFIIRPVITLSADILYQEGNGTPNNPYIVGEVVAGLEAELSQDLFLVNENVNIKDFLTVTARINGKPITLEPNDYEVIGFSTAEVTTTGVITITFRGQEITLPYSVRNIAGSLVPGAVSMTYTVSPNQINITITFNGQLQQFWYFFSENIEDMFIPHAQMQPRLTGTGTAGARVLNAPLNPDGTLRSGYYYVYAQRNGNEQDAFVIIKID